MRIEIGNLFASISILLDMAEKRSQHAAKTTYISLVIAEKLGLDIKLKKRIYYASFLHDIGISISTTHFYAAHQDFDLAREHALNGSEIVKKLPLDEDICTLIKYHHEFYDGSGAFGLNGDQIPFGSQIITLADQVDISFDNNIPYYYQLDDIKNWVIKNKGTLFNPLLVDAFLDVASKDKFWLDITNPNLKNIINDLVPSGKLYFDINKMISFAEAISIIIDRKSPFTNEHSHNLKKIVSEIVKEYGFDQNMQEQVKIAALLHDLGKLAVPNEILDKPSTLTKEEFAIVISHPYYTKYVLNQIPSFRGNIAEWAGNHHEKLDRSGYPERLGKEELSIIDRIMAISDVYQALCEDRPYRKGLAQSKAFEIIGDMVKNNKIGEEEFILLKKVVRG